MVDANLTKMSTSAFIKGVVRRLKEVRFTGKKYLFPRVIRCADIDLELLKKIPQWPCACVTNLGGELRSVNGEIWDKLLGVTMVNKFSIDGVLDDAMDWLDRATEVVQNELEESRGNDNTTGDPIYCVSENEDSIISADGGSYAMKTLVFAYSIDRVTS